MFASILRYSVLYNNNFEVLPGVTVSNSLNFKKNWKLSRTASIKVYLPFDNIVRFLVKKTHISVSAQKSKINRRVVEQQA